MAEEIRTIVAILGAVISLTGLGVSVVTFIKVSNLDFEVKRQRLLTEHNAHEITHDLTINNIDSMLGRIYDLEKMETYSNYVEQINEVSTELEATREALIGLRKMRNYDAEKIEAVKPSLSGRSLLEKMAGAEVRLHARLAAINASGELSKYEKKVSEIESNFPKSR